MIRFACQLTNNIMNNDKYLRSRGGHAQMITVSCAACGKILFEYQKDGVGWLKRCYLNRIMGIGRWEKLQHDIKIKIPSDMPNLICGCGKLIGVPMLHEDGRLAFRLERGGFKRKRI